MDFCGASLPILMRTGDQSVFVHVLMSVGSKLAAQASVSMFNKTNFIFLSIFEVSLPNSNKAGVENEAGSTCRVNNKMARLPVTGTNNKLTTLKKQSDSKTK